MKRSLFLGLACALAARGVAGQDTTFRGITITGQYDPRRDRPGILVMPVAGAFGDSVRAIIMRDLDYSDRFTVVTPDESDLPALRAAGAAAGLNYPLIARLGAVAVVQVTTLPNGLHVALHDVARGAVINVDEVAVGTSGLSRDWRLGVHRVSDEVERWITGQAGIAATRIAYLRGGMMRIIDSDGASEITVPAEENAYSPAWNPSGSMLAYTTFGATPSRVYLLDVSTGRSQTLVEAIRNTTYVSPVFSPDGTTLVYARSGERGSDLYAVPAGGGDSPRALTAGHGSENTNPPFSPDGHRGVFMTNREGPPELSIMDADGTNETKLTNYDFSEKNWRADPDWSPDNRLVAYSERINGDFQVKTIPARGGTPRQLTNDGENQQPSWAPDARHIVFKSDRTGVPQLWVLDVESSRLRQLTKAAGAKLPAWSPRLTAPPQ
jgi:TolB protein